MYRVIKFFTDLHDNDYAYHVGDTFPREGVSVTQKRFDELAGNNNKQGSPLIEEIEELADSEDPERSVVADKPAKQAGKPTTRAKKRKTVSKQVNDDAE